MQKHWSSNHGWQHLSEDGASQQAQLVLAFGDTAVLRQASRLDEIKGFFPHAHVVGCSTGGEILEDRVSENSLVVTAIWFESSTLRLAETTLDGIDASFDAGARLAHNLAPDGLTHILVLSAGLNVDGSALARGLQSHLPASVAVTGGLAADGANFEDTFVFLDTVSEQDTAVAIGFYGEALQIGCGCGGGWDSFGPDRLVTRAEGNIVYELDGQSVLELYRMYLGEQAAGLPATGLFFPLSLTLEGSDQRLVRTIQSINEENGSATFTGAIPEGSYARLMRGNFERLVDGAAESARHAQVLGPAAPQLAIAISCAGRKLVLKQRIDEEIESVRNTFGSDTVIAGFYSHGEICPVEPTMKRAELHNQTMTLTTISEGRN